MPSVFIALLFLACHPAAVVGPDSSVRMDTDTDTDADGDADSDTDADSDADTDSLSLDADFDSGSVGSFSIQGDTVQLTPVTVTPVNQDRSYAYWLHFRLSGAAAEARELTLEITGVEGNSFFGERDNDVQMVFSCDGETWGRMSEHAYDAAHGGSYTVRQAFGCDPVTVATFFPFSYGTMETWLAEVAQHEDAELSTIGSSEQGRDIRLLSITNGDLPDEVKRSVFILSRQHAAETAGSYQLAGLVDFLISEDPEASPLRDGFVWRIVPMVNPDGVYLGHSRTTSELRDSNADWGNGESVEVVAVRSLLEELSAAGSVDMVLDWHNQMNDVRWEDFVYSPSGNTFFPVLSQWTGFDTEYASGASSCTATDCSSRGWTMSHVLYDPVFVLEPCPHDPRWTVESLREQGELSARAIGAFFEGQP